MAFHAPTTFIAAAIMLLLVGPARAASRDAVLTGTSLAIDSPCARHVDIQPDAGLHGQVSVRVVADHQEELDRLLLESHDTARLRSAPGGCWDMPGNGQRTLDLTIKVPVGFALAIDEDGAPRYDIGPVGGGLTVDLSGTGDVDLGQVSGAATLSLSGHGKITIGQAAIRKLKVELSGSGRVSVGHGRVGDATLDASGAGAIDMGADTGDAEVDISGAAEVHFAKVSGRLDKDVSGAGSVSVGN
jgi:hypothetical protein